MSRKERARLPSKLVVVAAALVSSLALLGVLLLGTNPDRVGPIGVTGGFALFFVAILSTLVIIKMLLLRSTDVSARGLITISLIPTLILALRTLKQLTPIDVTLLLLFAVLFNFYLKRTVGK